MFYVFFLLQSLYYIVIIYMLAVADRLPRLGERELFFLLSFTCNYVDSVRRGFLLLFVLLVLRIGCAF